MWVDLSTMKMRHDEDIMTFKNRWREAYNLLGINVPEQHIVQMIMSNAQPGISSLLHMNRCTTFVQLYQVDSNIQEIL